MTTSYDLPMPHDRFDGRIVVASSWASEAETDPYGESHALLLLLNPQAPYYTVAEIKWSGGDWRTTDREDHPNINPAVADYADRGGDY